MSKLLLTLTLMQETPLHITGNYRVWSADKAMARVPTRDSNGSYVVPATSLKGSLRSIAETILRTWNQPVCLAPSADSMCSGPNFCLICRVFGNPRLTTPLKFSDALCEDKELFGSIRSGVSISRYRKAALHQRLFFIETAEPNPTKRWKASISGWFSNPDAAKEAAALVDLSTRFIQAVGAARTRGLGWVTSIEMTAILDDKPLSSTDIQQYWQTWQVGDS